MHLFWYRFYQTLVGFVWSLALIKKFNFNCYKFETSQDLMKIFIEHVLSSMACRISNFFQIFVLSRNSYKLSGKWRKVVSDGCECHVQTMKKYPLHLNLFSGLKTAFDVDRYLFGVLSTCEDVRENFEPFWQRLDR